MDEFYVEPAELRACAQYLRTLAAQFDGIRGFVTTEGCDTGGFTGLLTLLQPAVGGVGDLYGATLDFGRDRLNGSADGLDATAVSYEAADRQLADHQNSIAIPVIPEPVVGN